MILKTSQRLSLGALRLLDDGVDLVPVDAQSRVVDHGHAWQKALSCVRWAGDRRSPPPFSLLRLRRLRAGLRGTPTLGRRGGGGLLARRGARALLTKPRALCHFRSRRCVVGRDHRIIGWQAPLRAVFVRRHAERRQVPAQRLEFFAVVQTEEVIGRDRFTNGDRRFLFLDQRGGNYRPACELRQCRMHGLNQRWQVRYWQGIVGDEGRHDVGG